jgi:hypothetical protein
VPNTLLLVVMLGTIILSFNSFRFAAILSLYLVPSLFMVIARQRARRAARVSGAPQPPRTVEPVLNAA